MGNPVTTGLLDTVTNTETTNTDQSKAFGGVQNASQGQLGSNFTIADSAGNTINTIDPGAVAAGRAVAIEALDTGAAGVARVTGTAELIAQKSLDLATASQQGQGGTLINGLIWIAGLSVAGGLIYALSRKKAKKGKP